MAWSKTGKGREVRVRSDALELSLDAPMSPQVREVLCIFPSSSALCRTASCETEGFNVLPARPAAPVLGSTCKWPEMRSQVLSPTAHALSTALHAVELCTSCDPATQGHPRSHSQEAATPGHATRGSSPLSWGLAGDTSAARSRPSPAGSPRPQALSAQ